jgi:phosphatidylinositol glycan class W
VRWEQVSVFVWSALQARAALFTPYRPLAFIIDWLVTCGAALAAVTVYANAPLLLNALLLLPALICVLSARARAPAAAKARRRPRASTAASSPASPKGERGGGEDGKEGVGEKEAPRDPAPLPAKPFIGMYRGAMMAATCAAILAVDFRVFPRRFAKVENWGTSLMDLGVGSFVFAAGVVSPRRALLARLEGRPAAGLARRLRAAARGSVALLALGAARTWSVKGVGYAEHVSEYGVHWNFFFTLGLLPPVLALLESLFAYVPREAVALAVAAGYEVLLDNTELTAYIVTAPRDNLVSMNREGLCSFLGYLAIFLAGSATGLIVLPRDTSTSLPPLPSTASRTARARRWLTTTPHGRLLSRAAVSTALFLACTEYRGLNLRVSRRLANLPYVLWIAAFNDVQILLCMWAQDFAFPDLLPADLSRLPAPRARLEERKRAEMKEELARRARGATSRVLDGFNRNGLAVFLLANLLTGAVNLALPTLDMGTARAMAVLVAYMGVLGAAAAYMPKLSFL